MPRVSVIIPVYNGDRYVVQAVESVLNQTYKSYEIIVVDDGSTDKTYQVLQPYLDLVYYVYQPNQGVSTARNRGIQQANGELIALLDADDFFLPDKLTDQVAYFDVFPNVGVVHSGWCLVSEQGNEILAEHQPWLGITHLDLEAWLLWRPILPSAMMFRRGWLERISGFDTRLSYAEDAEIVFRLALAGCESVWLKKITTAYRSHSQSATVNVHNTGKQAKAFDEVYDRFFAASNLPKSIHRIERSARYNYLVWLAWRFYNTGYPEQMAEYLRQALLYTPFSIKTEAILSWTKLFTDYSSLDSRSGSNAYSLSKLPEWKKVVFAALTAQEPRVSIIIPTYNCDSFIAAAIESVLAQTYTDYEILVVDDGSIDTTCQVLQAYRDRIRYVYQENQGAAKARNRALQLARGELIAFLDADDLFMPHKLAAQVSCFDADPQLGMVQSGWRIINSLGEMISDVTPWHYAPRLDLDTFFMYKPVRPSAMMIRRSWCEQVGGFNHELPPTEDLEFCLSLTLMGCKAVWLRQIHTSYRQHSANLMSGGRQVMENTDNLIKLFLARPDIPAQIRCLEKQEHYQRLVWFAWRFHRDGYDNVMFECLGQCLYCTPLSSTETILDWLNKFRLFSMEYGFDLDLPSLITSYYWRRITALATKSIKFANASNFTQV